VARGIREKKRSSSTNFVSFETFFMKYDIDFSQPSTLRGAIWIVSGVVAGIFIAFGEMEKAQAIGALAATIAGGIGVALKD
jgi:uncharacterized membrane protein